MICPEGFSTPSTLRSEFFRVLSNDRVLPLVYEAAETKYSCVQTKDLAKVIETASTLFTYQFLSENRESMFLFCPTRTAPMKADSWILRGRAELCSELPVSKATATIANEMLRAHFAFLCPIAWAIDANAEEIEAYGTGIAATWALTEFGTENGRHATNDFKKWRTACTVKAV